LFGLLFIAAAFHILTYFFGTILQSRLVRITGKVSLSFLSYFILVMDIKRIRLLDYMRGFPRFLWVYFTLFVGGVAANGNFFLHLFNRVQESRPIIPIIELAQLVISNALHLITSLKVIYFCQTRFKKVKHQQITRARKAYEKVLWLAIIPLSGINAFYLWSEAIYDADDNLSMGLVYLSNGLFGLCPIISLILYEYASRAAWLLKKYCTYLPPILQDQSRRITHVEYLNWLLRWMN
jgi:hypothetical protein